MKRFSLLSYIIIFFTFFLGFSIMLITQMIKNPSLSSPTLSLSSTQSPIVLVPPSESLKGILSETKGNITKIPWDITHSIPATVGATVYQGDELQIQQQSQATITFSLIGQIAMEEMSEIIFSNLLPEKMNLRQKNGLVHYMNISNQYPINIRARNVLIELKTGEADITVDIETTTISLLSGTATIGYVDEENNTKVIYLKEGESVSVPS